MKSHSYVGNQREQPASRAGRLAPGGVLAAGGSPASSSKSQYRFCHLCHIHQVKTDVGRLVCDKCEADVQQRHKGQELKNVNAYLDAFAKEWRRRYG